MDFSSMSRLETVPEYGNAFRPGSDIVSSLPLQMSLYFNIYFAPFWIVTHIITAYIKYESLTTLYQVVTVATLLVMSLLEVARLYLGYAGNLYERIAQLAGCWLISVILQLPLLSILMFMSWEMIAPVEIIIDLIYSLFLLIQVATCFTTLQRITDKQRLKFQLQVNEDLLWDSRD